MLFSFLLGNSDQARFLIHLLHRPVGAYDGADHGVDGYPLVYVDAAEEVD